MEDKKKLKVVIATGIYPPDIGGPATYLSQFVPFLKSQGDQVQVVSFGNTADLKEDEEDGVAVSRVPRDASPWKRFFSYYKVLKKNARESDLIYVHDMSLAGLAAFFVHKNTRIPYIIRIGGDFIWEQAYQRRKTNLEYLEFQGREPLSYKIRRKISNKILKRARAVIVPSEFLKTAALKWGLDPQKVKVVKNAVEIQDFIGRSVEDETLDRIVSLKNHGKKVIVSSGRFVNWKNFDVLIKAVAGLKDTHLILIGDGPEKKNLEDLSEKLNIQDRIDVVGSKSRLALFKIFFAADCFALLSIGDTFSFVALEALYAGTPVLLAKKSGLAEIFRNFDGRGVTFTEDLAEDRIEKVLGDISKLSKPSEEIKKELKNQFKIEDHFDAVYGIMRGI